MLKPTGSLHCLTYTYILQGITKEKGLFIISTYTQRKRGNRKEIDPSNMRNTLSNDAIQHAWIYWVVDM